MKFPEHREKFARAWGVESLPAHTGYRISELPRARTVKCGRRTLWAKIRCRPTPSSLRCVKRLKSWSW